MPHEPTQEKQRPWWSPKKRKAHARRKATNHSNVYNTRKWINRRQAHIRRYPICGTGPTPTDWSQCRAEGIITGGQVVDHIMPINQGGDPWDWNNLQTLCHRCHNRKSGIEAHNRIERKLNH